MESLVVVELTGSTIHATPVPEKRIATSGALASRTVVGVDRMADASGDEPEAPRERR